MAGDARVMVLLAAVEGGAAGSCFFNAPCCCLDITKSLCCEGWRGGLTGWPSRRLRLLPSAAAAAQHEQWGVEMITA